MAITMMLFWNKQRQEEEAEGVNTTLQAYFFGKNGDNKLQYLDFCR